MFNASYRQRTRIGAGVPFLVAIGLLHGAFATPSEGAETILSTGFESPYVAGMLEGQFSWSTSGGGTSTAVVQNSVVHSGSQAVRVQRTSGSDRRWAVPGLVGYPTQRFVTIDWDMLVNGPAGNAGAGEFGPFFGVDTYDGDSGIFVLGTLGVDATTGDVLFQNQDTGFLTETPLDAVFGDWNHYRIVLDFMTDTYRGFFNGTQVASTGFVDRGFGLNNFTDADIAAFAAGSDAASRALSGTAVFDNFVIRDGLLGDYDVNGTVDSLDYTRWRATFGTTVAMAGHGADGNENGTVDAADYVVWRNNLGTSLFSGASLQATVVPEPAAILLGFVGAATFTWLIAGRRPRR